MIGLWFLCRYFWGCQEEKFGRDMKFEVKKKVADFVIRTGGISVCWGR